MPCPHIQRLRGWTRSPRQLSLTSSQYFLHRSLLLCLRVVGLQKGGPFLSFQALPSSALWTMTRTPDLCFSEPTPDLVPTCGSFVAIVGTLMVLIELAGPVLLTALLGVLSTNLLGTSKFYSQQYIL